MKKVSWTFSISRIMKPSRELLKANTKYYWGQHVESLFHQSKNRIISDIKATIKMLMPLKQTYLLEFAYTRRNIVIVRHLK